MGQTDITLKEYFSDTMRLADLFNYYCFDGEETIRAPELRPANPVSTAVIPETGVSGKEQKRNCGAKQTKNHTERHRKNYAVERIRDVLAAATKDGTTFLLLGIENQSETHYGMPVRQMLYDALTYAGQITEREKEALRNASGDGSSPAPTAAEFLSGLRKGDKLSPVLTLTVYYGREPWDGPRNLSELLDTDRLPPELKPYITDQYPINLLEVRKIRDWKKFRTDLRDVFRLASCDNDKEQMRRIIEENESYRHLAHDAVNAIAVLTASDQIREYAERQKGDEINMCKAIDDMIKDGEARGITIGEERGIAIGEKRGITIGEERGLQKGIEIFILDNLEENIPRERIVQKLQRNFNLSVEAAGRYMLQYGTV